MFMLGRERYSALSFLLALIFLAGIPACKHEGQRQTILGREKFIDVYCAALEQPGKRNVMTTDSVFSQYGTNAAEFWATVGSYSKEPEQWKPVLEEVIRRLEKKGAEENVRKPSGADH